MKLFILAVLLCSASAIEFDRPCRTDVAAKENFLTAVYEGTWLEIQNTEIQENANCVIHHYTRRPILSQFDVVRDVLIENRWFHESGTAFVAFPDETPMRAIFNATLHRMIGGNVNFNYQIVATDYSNYAITWTCVNLADNRSDENGAVLARALPLSPTTDARITDIIETIGLNRDDFRTIEHSQELCLS